MNARNLLTSIAANVGVGLPNNHVLDPSLDVRGIVSAINDAGDDLFRRAEWPDAVLSTSLPRQGPVPGIAASSTYVLPENYGYVSAQGGVIAIQDEEGGPFSYDISPNLMEFITFKDTGIAIINQGRVHTHDDAPSVALIYVTSAWCSSGSEIGHDEDTFVIPYRLLKNGAEWRWRESRGLDHKALEERWYADIAVQIEQLQATAR